MSEPLPPPAGTPASHVVDCAGIELHVTEWGADRPETVVMWHGLARTGRDFDTAARALSNRYRLLCPDTPGRGLSQWLPPEQYRFATYERIALAMLDAFQVKTLRWIGTSMGGVLGMRLAAGPLAERMTHLLINDIGPELQAEAVARIGTYAGNPPVFDRLARLEAYLRQVYEPFGALSDADWRLMADTSARRLPDGRLTLHYDPAMAGHLTDQPDDWVVWDAYDRVPCPTLLLRGERSDLLSADLAARMAGRGPRCRIETIPGCGHAPALNTEDQIALVADFLAS